MGREPRAFETGGIYLLSPKGNNGRRLFFNDLEFGNFLGRIEVLPRHQIEVIGYVLMSNHVHLLVIVRGPGEALSRAMQIVLGGYSRWWNRHNGCKAHAFEARFHSRTVETDSHLMAAARYVDRNPVKAGMIARPEDYEWSSYRAHVSLIPAPPFLANPTFLSLIGTSPERAKVAYEEFVRDPDRGPQWPPPEPPRQGAARRPPEPLG